MLFHSEQQRKTLGVPSEGFLFLILVWKVFYLNEKLNLIKKSKSTVTRPDMIDYELCKIQFMEEK